MTAAMRSSSWRYLAAGAVVVLSLISVAPLPLGLESSVEEMVVQGPAAVDPDLSDEIAPLIAPSMQTALQHWIHLAGLVVFTGLGILIVWKGGTSANAPLAGLTLATLGAALFAPLGLLPGGETLARIVGSITPTGLSGFWGSLAGLCLIAFLARFPDGQWRPRWSRSLLVAAAITGVSTTVAPGFVLSPGAWPGALQAIWLLMVPVTLAAGQLSRRRQARFDPATRNVVLSLFAAIAAFVLLWIIQPELTPGVLELVVVTPRLRAAYAVNILLVLTAAVFLFPVSVSFSIARYRLFDVDFILNRALVYGAVTGLIGVVFLTVAYGLSLAVSGETAALGVGLGAFVVLVFQPLRARTQRAVDRRFYRERYDAAKLITNFANEVTRFVEPTQLEAGLISVVERALRPMSVHLHTGEVVGKVSGLIDDSATDLSQVTPGPPPPFDGAHVLVPLQAGGELVGVLQLGPRSSSGRYSRLDLELLDQLAKAAGPSLQLAHEVADRERKAIESQRAAGELELARKIQQGLLPQGVPDVEGWGFEAFYRPAREVGGDFYDWIDLPDGRLGIIIGDVSDKGIPAALVMATCRTLIRSAAGSGLSPGELLADVNDRLLPDIPEGMFVTCQVAYLDRSTGFVVMANAGHNLPYLCETGSAKELMIRGMPLGLMPEMSYEPLDAHIPDGASLVLSSDGFAESHRQDGEMYGTERFQESLRRANGSHLHTAMDAHGDFVGSDWEQEDDMTLVTVTRT